MMRLSRRPKEPELIQLSRSVYYKQVVSNDGGDGDVVCRSLMMMMMMMMMTVVMIMAVTMAMDLSIMTATTDGENDSGLVMITVMNLAKNCKADCFTR